MAITLKLHEIVNAQPAFNRLAATDLSIKVGYWIAKRLSKIERELKDYNKKLQDLYKKYKTEPVENEPGKVQITKGDREAFGGDVEELHNIDVILDIDPIKLADIEDAKLPVGDLMLLDKFIVE